jgi:hypothetical protein
LTTLIQRNSYTQRHGSAERGAGIEEDLCYAGLPSHLWFFDGARLPLMSGSEEIATVQRRVIQAPSEGMSPIMAEQGESLVMVDAGALAVPRCREDAEIGVLEAVNKPRVDLGLSHHTSRHDWEQSTSSLNETPEMQLHEWFPP